MAQVRKVVCTTILATDMSCHFSLQSEFEQCLKHTEQMQPTAAQHAAQNKAFILKSSLRMTLISWRFQNLPIDISIAT